MWKMSKEVVQALDSPVRSPELCPRVPCSLPQGFLSEVYFSLSSDGIDYLPMPPRLHAEDLCLCAWQRAFVSPVLANALQYLPVF